jgi:alpha-ribazole phosphatase
MMVWRHARPREVLGRCIGRTEVVVDARKSKRLAHRIRAWARRHALPRVVVTSPLRRAADTGRWLARWGWQHRIDPRLLELDFGTWDGKPWADIARPEFDAWCAAFVTQAPGGGEAVGVLLSRCASFLEESKDVCVVGHAGWISAALWLEGEAAEAPQASTWPAAVGYGVQREFTRAAG